MTQQQARDALAGPWRFRLVRTEDESGVSGTGHVADGVRFADGSAALRWRTRYQSTAVYASMADLIAIHGHGGKTEVRWLDREPTEAFLRAVTDCIQDSCENAPFASVGGLDKREDMTAPAYITKHGDAYTAEWLRGYTTSACAMYGDDWRTCGFGWQPALTIGGAP